MVWVLKWLSFFDHWYYWTSIFEFLLIVRSMWNDSPMVYSQMILVGRIGRPGRSRRIVRLYCLVWWWRSLTCVERICWRLWFGLIWRLMLAPWTVDVFLSDWKPPGCFLECFFLVGRHVFFCLMWLEVAKILRTNWANDRFKFNFMKGILLNI